MIAKEIWLSFPCCFDALAFLSQSLRKHFFPPLCSHPNLPRYKQWRRWSPLSTAAQACLSSLVSQFFLPSNDSGSILLSTACFPPLLPARRAGWTLGGNNTGCTGPKTCSSCPHGRSAIYGWTRQCSTLPNATILHLFFRDSIYPSCKIHTTGKKYKVKSTAERKTLN